MVDFTKAVLDTGYGGFLSVEVFDGRAPGKYDEMSLFADKAMDSLQRLLQGSE